jgi:hypothetical protein
VDDTLVGSAVAEEDDHHAVGPADLLGQSGASSERNAAGHDAVAAEDIRVDIGDVHGAAETPAITRLAAHQFGHHPVHRGALRDAMAVATMGAGDVVALAEVRTGGSRYRLFADVAMCRALDESGAEQLRRPLVETADLDHSRVHRFEDLDAEIELHRGTSGPVIIRRSQVLAFPKCLRRCPEFCGERGLDQAAGLSLDVMA